MINWSIDVNIDQWIDIIIDIVIEIAIDVGITIAIINVIAFAIVIHIALFEFFCKGEYFHSISIHTSIIFKQAEKHADFSTLKIWYQSDRWLKRYGQKVQIWPKKLFGHNFWASGPIDPKFWVWKNLQVSRLVC